MNTYMRWSSVLFLLAFATSWSVPVARAETVVLCVGDSITWGYGVSVPYPTRLRNNTGYATINRGVGGVSVSYGLAVIDGLMDQNKPSHVLILYGTNNMNDPDANPSGAANTVLQIALRARAKGGIPVIGTIPPQIGPRAGYNANVRAFNSSLRSYASANGIALADIEAAFGSAAGLMMSDGFHPNDAGAEKIAQTFAAKIKVKSLSLSPSSAKISYTGAVGRTFAVITRYAWKATANRDWIAITSGASGSGNGTVTYDVSGHVGVARSGTITVSNEEMSRKFTVAQAASPSLTIASRYGTPEPAAGTYWVTNGTATNASMIGSPVVIGTTTQYVCRGWVGTGSAPKQGTDMETGPFVVSNTTKITWLWKTNYWLETAVEGSGTVNVASGWIARKSNVVLQAVSAEGARFFRWSGASASRVPKIKVSMTGAKSLTAWFGVDVSVQARGLDGSTRAATIRTTIPDVFQKTSGKTPCRFGYANGAAVGLNAPATLAGGWKLVGWEGVDSWDDTNATWIAQSSNLVTVLYDPQPSVTITNPTVSSAFRTTNAALNLKGRAAGFNGLIRVEVSNARSERDRICAGTTDWSYDGLTLYPGVNPITVKAYDVYTNVATDTLRVTYSSKGLALQGLALLAGAVIRDIQMPDNLMPGDVCTVRWQVEAYEPMRSGLKIRLPEGPGVTNVTINGRLAGTAPGIWRLGEWTSKLYSFEADWTVPDRPGACRIRFPTARQDGFAYVHANIPDGVETPPYGMDGKEISRTIVAGGTPFELQNEVLARDAKPFERMAEAQRRAGAVVRNIDIPDNLIPGSVVTCKWSVLSYPALKSRLRIELPSENPALGNGTLKRKTSGAWRLPAAGTIVEYDGTAANDASAKVTKYYKMGQRDMQCVWRVPNDPGTCRIGFEVALSSGSNWVDGVLREGVDGRIETNHVQILRDIEENGVVPAVLAMGETNALGNIQYAGDADWFEFTAILPGTYRIQTYPGTLKDTILKLYGPGNRTDLIGQNDNAVKLASRLVLALDPGTYYIKITAPPAQKGMYKLLVAPEP